MERPLAAGRGPVAVLAPGSAQAGPKGVPWRPVGSWLRVGVADKVLAELERASLGAQSRGAGRGGWEPVCTAASAFAWSALDGSSAAGHDRAMGRDLASMACVPCQGGVPPLTRAEIESYLADLDAGWRVVDDHHLEKEWRFRNFREALAFTNRVGELAEEVGHHPDIELGWGRVKLTVYTHKINGLHEADFVFAAKVDALSDKAS
jgi:4a-hydroxytetrahydrobiopterin dehydratase